MGRLCRGRAAEQNEGRGEIKHFSCFHWPVLLYGPYFKGAPICPRRPEAPGGKSSNGWRLASSTGNLTPRVVLTQPPPLPATDHGKQSCFNARTLGWTGVSLSPLLVMAVPVAIRYWQPAVSRSLPGKQTKDLSFLFRWYLVVFSRQITAQQPPGLWLSSKQRECA